MNLGREYDIIVRSLTTEKTARASAENKYYFEVVVSADKNQVKEAIEKIFDVVIESVNMINREGKVKKFKGHVGKRKSSKKAIVTIKKGQNINLGKLE